MVGILEVAASACSGPASVDIQVAAAAAGTMVAAALVGIQVAAAAAGTMVAAAGAFLVDQRTRPCCCSAYPAA